jgi:putative ABC transport system permease protein
MYLIYNAVSISVVSAGKRSAFCAPWARRAKIIALFLGEIVVMAVVGSGLGIGVGILFAQSAIGVVGQAVSELYLRTSIPEISVSGPDLFVGFVTGIAASLAAALLPALASTRVTPISAIRSAPYSEEGFLSGRRLKIAALLFLILAAALLMLYKAREGSPVFHSTTAMFSATIFILLGISLATPAALQGFLSFFRRIIAPRVGTAGRLAGLNLQKNITRNAVAAAAIFYGIAVFVSSSGIIYSTKQSVLDWIDSYVRGDIIVTSGHPIATSGAQNIPMPVEMWKDIEKVPGVLSADPFRKIYIDYHGRRILLLTVDIAKRFKYSPFKIARGKREDMARLLPNQDYVAVNEAVASQEHIKPGDTMVLPTPGGPVSFIVAVINVDYSSDSGSIFMDLRTYQRYWKEYLADSFSIRVTSPENVMPYATRSPKGSATNGSSSCYPPGSR